MCVGLLHAIVQRARAPVDGELARVSAEIRSKYRVPMADSVIAASAKSNRLKCVTDDARISEVDEIETVWL